MEGVEEHSSSRRMIKFTLSLLVIGRMTEWDVVEDRVSCSFHEWDQLNHPEGSQSNPLSFTLLSGEGSGHHEGHGGGQGRGFVVEEDELVDTEQKKDGNYTIGPKHLAHGRTKQIQDVNQLSMVGYVIHLAYDAMFI